MISKILTDAEGRILFEDGAGVLQNPASLTKLMTLYLVFRDLPFDRMVTVPASAVVRRRPNRVPQSNMGLLAEQKVSVMDLVLGMIVPSANDAAATIAAALDTQDFPELLNVEAAELGLKNTRFATASGLGQGETTARDMVFLSRRLWADFPQYRTLFSIGSFSFNGRRFRTTNDLLFKIKGMAGLKTGTTKELRRNLAAVVAQGDKTFFSVVLNCPDKKTRDQHTSDMMNRALGGFYEQPPVSPRAMKPAPIESSINQGDRKMGLLAYPMIWTINSLADFLGAPKIGTLAGSMPVTRILTSAQHSTTGDIYVPTSIEAGRRNGMARLAIKNGAVGVMTSDPDLKGDFPIILVSNMSKALRELAHHAREQFTGQIIGITGSVGKTTTKDMLSLCLGFCGSTHYTAANLNSGNANLATVASLPAVADYSVMEISLMGLGAVRRKSAVAQPNVSLITSIGVSHGEHHGKKGIEAVLVGKTEMFSNTVKGGTAVLPSGDKMFAAMVQRAKDSERIKRVISCGTEPDDTVRLVASTLHPTYSEVSIEVEGKLHDYLIAQPGEHFVMNSLLVAGGLLALGANLDALGGLSAYTPTERRVERFRVDLPKGGVIELVDDAYNAAPDSVRALLKLCKQRSSAKRRVLILGDMLELGPDEIKMHLDLAPDIEESHIDLLITVGPNSEKIASKLKNLQTCSYPDAKSAAKEIESLIVDRDLVLVKGSNGMDLIRVVNALRGPKGTVSRQGMDWSIETEV